MIERLKNVTLGHSFAAKFQLVLTNNYQHGTFRCFSIQSCSVISSPEFGSRLSFY